MNLSVPNSVVKARERGNEWECELTKEWMRESTEGNELSPITLFVFFFQFTCVLVSDSHSRPLSPRSIWSGKSSILGLLQIWFGWEYEVSTLHMLEKSALDRSCDACCWPKWSRPRRTRMAGRWLGWPVVRLIRVFICLLFFFSIPYRIFQGSRLHCCSWYLAGKTLEFQDIHKIPILVFHHFHVGMSPFHMDCGKEPSLHISILYSKKETIKSISNKNWTRYVRKGFLG